jgi:hypothetical protein
VPSTLFILSLIFVLARLIFADRFITLKVIKSADASAAKKKFSVFVCNFYVSSSSKIFMQNSLARRRKPVLTSVEDANDTIRLIGRVIQKQSALECSFPLVARGA